MKRLNWNKAAVPVIMLSYCISYMVQTYQLPFRSTLFPYLLICLVVVLFGVLGLQQVFARRLTDAPDPSRIVSNQGTAVLAQLGPKVLAFCKENYRPLTLIVGTFLFTVIVEYLGFFLTLACLFSVFFWTFRVGRRALILPMSITISAVLTYILLIGLRFALPPFAFSELPFGL
jgi:hypothetical protein